MNCQVLRKAIILHNYFSYCMCLNNVGEIFYIEQEISVGLYVLLMHTVSDHSNQHPNLFSPVN